MTSSAWHPVQEECAALQRGVAELADDVLEQLLASASGYRRVPRPEVADALGRNLRVLLSAYAQQRALTAPEVEALAAPAETRAHEGIGLDDVLTAFTIAAEVSGKTLDARLSGTATAEVRLALAELRLEALQATLRAAAEAHRRGELSVDRERQQRRSDALRRLLRGEVPRNELVTAAEAVGLRPNLPHHLVRVRPAGPEHRRALLERLTRATSTGHVVALDDDVALLLTEAVLPGLDDCSAGAAGPLSLDELAAGWREVTQVVEAAAAVGLSGAWRREELGLRLVVPQHPQVASDLAARYVVPLRGTRGMPAQLVETVRAYLDGGRRREAAAERLHLHPTTVSYRLTRFCEFTDADLESTATLAELWWLLVALDMGLLSLDE